jgi:hypothetical protein
MRALDSYNNQTLSHLLFSFLHLGRRSSFFAGAVRIAGFESHKN